MRNTGANFHKASSSLFFEFVNFLFLLVLCEHCSLCVLWLGPELEFEEKKNKKRTRNSAKILDQTRRRRRAHTDGLYIFFFAIRWGERDSTEKSLLRILLGCLCQFMSLPETLDSFCCAAATAVTLIRIGDINTRAVTSDLWVNTSSTSHDDDDK